MGFGDGLAEGVGAGMGLEIGMKFGNKMFSGYGEKKTVKRKRAKKQNKNKGRK